MAGTSRIDFTPAHTTSTGTRPSTARSADTSWVCAAPRCTPPNPPVAKTRMPARHAKALVDATVVAPVRPSAAATPRSRSESLSTSSAAHNRCSAASSSPTCTTPSSIAIVAGTAPPARTADSISRPIRRLSPRGNPWARMVLSNATTGRPSASAAATSGAQTDPVGMRGTLR